MRTYHMSRQMDLTSNGRTHKDSDMQYPITPADGSKTPTTALSFAKLMITNEQFSICCIDQLLESVPQERAALGRVSLESTP